MVRSIVSGATHPSVMALLNLEIAGQEFEPEHNFPHLYVATVLYCIHLSYSRSAQGWRCLVGAIGSGVAGTTVGRAWPLTVEGIGWALGFGSVGEVVSVMSL